MTVHIKKRQKILSLSKAKNGLKKKIEKYWLRAFCQRNPARGSIEVEEVKFKLVKCFCL